MKLCIMLDLKDDDGNSVASTGGYITDVETRSVDEVVAMIATRLKGSVETVLPDGDKTVH